MEIPANKPVRIFAAVMAFLAWGAVILQFYLVMINLITDLKETIIRFFSFFTILTNLMVAVSFSAILLFPGSLPGKFFRRATTHTAITVYIILVGATYNLLLRFLWSPEGLQKLADETLHSVIPLLSILFWAVFVPKKELEWKNCLPWLIYPLIYAVFIVIRGASSKFYPYPFINIAQIGYREALLNGLFLMLSFTGLSLFLIAIGKSRQ